MILTPFERLVLRALWALPRGNYKEPSPRTVADLIERLIHRASTRGYESPGIYNEADAMLDGEAAAALAAQAQRRDEVVEALADDEELATAFHRELRKQGAFSIEHYGKVALAMYPFLKLVAAALNTPEPK